MCKINSCNLNNITVLVCVGSTNTRNVIGLPANGKDIEQTLSVRGSACCIWVGYVKFYEIQSMENKIEFNSATMFGNGSYLNWQMSLVFCTAIEHCPDVE